MTNLGDYKSREDLIRDHWERYGFHWNLEISPSLRILERHRLYPYLAPETDSTHPTLPVLEFRFERGTMNGRPFGRVVCEGVVVEEAPL